MIDGGRIIVSTVTRRAGLGLVRGLGVCAASCARLGYHHTFASREYHTVFLGGFVSVVLFFWFFFLCSESRGRKDSKTVRESPE